MDGRRRSGGGWYVTYGAGTVTYGGDKLRTEVLYGGVRRWYVTYGGGMVPYRGDTLRTEEVYGGVRR